jgi:anti-anti-sigma factor
MGGDPGGFEIAQIEDGGDHTLRLSGEFDMAAVPTFEAAVAALHADGTRSVTIDLSALDFIDSTGLAAIVHLSGVCVRHGYDFFLMPGSPAVQRLFELTGLDGVLPFVGGNAASGG